MKVSDKRRLNPFQIYGSFWRNYFNFKTCSTRRTFWWTFLLNWAIRIFLLILSFFEANHSFKFLTIGLLLLYSLAALVPSISMNFRRYRDAGFSGWWIVCTVLMPYVFKWLTLANSVSQPVKEVSDLLLFGCVAIGFILAIMPSKVPNN